MFPDLAEAQRPNLRLLLQAKKWKELGEQTAGAGGDGEPTGDVSDAPPDTTEETPDELPPTSASVGAVDTNGANEVEQSSEPEKQNTESPPRAPSAGDSDEPSSVFASAASTATTEDTTAPSIATLRSRFLPPDDSS